MTVEELKELIKTGENGGVEFKRGRGGVPGDFWPSYSAFANTDGGGVKTSTKNFGLPDEELVVLRLTSSRVVEAMRRNPKVTREELVEQHRVTVNGINWQIAKLQKDKVFCRVGGRKFGSWEVRYNLVWMSKMNDFDKYYEATEPGYRERAIGWAAAIGDLYRNVNDGVKSVLNGTEVKAVKVILQNGRINALDLAAVLGVKKRQAERVIAALKSKAGLKRRGVDKNGEWYFESVRLPNPPNKEIKAEASRVGIRKKGGK